MITDEKEPRFFLHAHARNDRRCYYGARKADGTHFLTHHVLYAEAYTEQEIQAAAFNVIFKYPMLTKCDAVLCSSLEIIPAHMRIWER